MHTGSHLVYHLPAMKDCIHVHHDACDCACILRFKKGVGTTCNDFNLAPGHPYVVVHYRTMDHRCVLEIQQPKKKLATKNGDPSIPVPDPIQNVCFCEDLAELDCPDGTVPDCSIPGTITCVAPTPFTKGKPRKKG